MIQGGKFAELNHYHAWGQAPTYIGSAIPLRDLLSVQAATSGDLDLQRSSVFWEARPWSGSFDLLEESTISCTSDL